MRILYFFLFVFVLASCSAPQKEIRSYFDLNGEWQFALDTASVGIQQQWYLTNLADTISLPGTTDENQKGFKNNDTTTMHLDRVYKYEGAAWYRKSIIIPEEFAQKSLELIFERTKTTKVWIDSILIGGSSLLQSSQKFDVSSYLTPGKHYITVLVNNDLKLTPYGNVHIYLDDTQTNWNGILGKIGIQACSKTHIANIKVFPLINEKAINVQLYLANSIDSGDVSVDLLIEKKENGQIKQIKVPKHLISISDTLNFYCELDGDCSLWDDYNQPIYELTAIITVNGQKDAMTVPFGMRSFEVKGTQFAINNRSTFLRGKHEAAVFPLSGHVPMNVDDWVRVYKIAKSYGVNHYRFHSYCPPEAAFIAADQEGIFIQAELPFWGSLDVDSIAGMLQTEGKAMLDAYANHPSFVMFSHGNEIWGGHDRVEQNIITLKNYDNRPLYTMGSNNNIGYAEPRECSDYFVGARTPYSGDSILTHIRLIQAFVDSREGGIINTQTPSTEINFSYSVNNMKIPVVSHEIGQYQIYPNYKEIDKYTGVVRAWNLEVFKQRLADKGMAGMDSLFQQVTGAWSALCYKAEMEAALRTKGMAGFQLLDLQDYPGQGTALVGILDAFMDSKGVITPEAWKQSCNDVVVLLEFAKYCWTSNETFKAKVVVANYSNQNLSGDIAWEVSLKNGDELAKGTIRTADMKLGGLTTVGEITVDLSKIKQAQQLVLYSAILGTSYDNEYPLWVYPSKIEKAQLNEVVEVNQLDAKVISALAEGKKVLFFPNANAVSNLSVGGLFNPEFWNYGMFKGISEWVKKPVSPGTLGLLMNPEHPLFNKFPTDCHTSWEWFSIIKNSHPFILDNAPQGYMPIVQMIDNLERNDKLGVIFEFKVGNGKLLICMSELENIIDKPEARQLYNALVTYMNSDAFNPETALTIEELKTLFDNRK